jgi:hypothetical protein
MFDENRKLPDLAVVPEFDVVSSLWLDIGAERRHYNNQIKALPFGLGADLPVRQA